MVAVFAFAVYFLSRPAAPSNQNAQITTITPTPTSFPQEIKDIKVLSSFPAQNDEHIPPLTEITLTFQTNISENNKKLITVFFSPEVEFEFVWENAKTLKIKPKEEMKTNTRYNVTVNINQQNIYRFSFTTSRYTDKEIKEQVQIQIEDDLKFTETVNSFLRENPWYADLPLMGTGYMVVYDSVNKKFVIGLAENLSENDREIKTQEAVEAIRKIYPNLKEDEYYVFKP